MMFAFQRSAAIKAAVELDIFTKIGEGARTPAAIAHAAGASERGTRILCDYLAINALLVRSADGYELTPDSAVFLDRRSPAALASVVGFMMSPTMMTAMEKLTDTVRAGTTSLPDQGTVTPENPVWVKFAEAMVPMMYPGAQAMAQLVAGEGKQSVLDIAAGHGMFGVAIAEKNPDARITALDWAPVLEVAKRNAQRAGVADRLDTIVGNAFEVDFGGPYDIVLLPNFLHHFDIPTCEQLLRKVHASLTPGGRCAIFEFVPNEDRVTPPIPAAFSLIMLATTPSGDAYTFGQYQEMLSASGFESAEHHRLENSAESVIVARRR